MLNKFLEDKGFSKEEARQKIEATAIQILKNQKELAPKDGLKFLEDNRLKKEVKKEISERLYNILEDGLKIKGTTEEKYFGLAIMTIDFAKRLRWESER